MYNAIKTPNGYLAKVKITLAFVRILDTKVFFTTLLGIYIGLSVKYLGNSTLLKNKKLRHIYKIKFT